VRFTFIGKTEQIEVIDLNELREQGIEVNRKTDNQIKQINSARNSEFIKFDKKMIMDNFDEFLKTKDINKSRIKLAKKILKKCTNQIT